MKKFTISGKTYQAEDCVGGVLVNPKLPERFDFTPNDARPASHQKFWGLFAFYRQIKAQSAVALDQAAKNERSVLLFCCRHR